MTPVRSSLVVLRHLRADPTRCRTALPQVVAFYSLSAHHTDLWFYRQWQCWCLRVPVHTCSLAPRREPSEVPPPPTPPVLTARCCCRYEAYEKMAVAKMCEVCETMRSKWDLKGVYMAHRTGYEQIVLAALPADLSSAQTLTFRLAPCTMHLAP